MPYSKNYRDHAIQIFNAAVAAVHPTQLLKQHIAIAGNTLTICDDKYPAGSLKNVYVIGAGKAAASMAVATEKILGKLITDGLVVTKTGHSLQSERITIIEGAHPLPDESCVTAVNRTLALLKNVEPGDIVICLISGGASSLWCDVPEGITLTELKTSFDLLIRSGAAIQEVNIIRKHLSSIKGGQLVRHCNGAKVYSFILSDVVGDDPAAIASGPTVPCTATFEDAYRLILKYQLETALPASIIEHIKKGINGFIPQIIQTDSFFNRVCNRVIGNNSMAVAAGANKAGALGYTTYITPTPITGDVETEARKLTEMAILHQKDKPYCIIQGGETTVKVKGNGKGGRNQHFSLAALIELSASDRQKNDTEIILLSAGTDGTDGATNATGGITDSQTLRLAEEKKLSASAYLTNHDSYHYLEQTDSLIITGPTQTNVMDIMIALIN